MSSKRVIVAMSGGVDSSVTAALLKERGFEVIGITMHIWERSQESGGCCGVDSVEDARKVAYVLGIPHYVLNFRDVFRKRVIGNFCEEYKEGRTPNPCIKCNQYIKFGALLEKAKILDAEYISTGHYARIEFDQQRKRYLLKKGIDSHKDQSYVLYTMTQEQLRRTLMPIGEFTKKQVRQIAKEKKLPVAHKPESQEICFVPNNNYGAFLKEYTSEGTTPGPLVNREGLVIGKHQGIISYTIGQRKRIRIAAEAPFYVVAIDKKRNTVVVGKREEVYSDELIADNAHFIDRENLETPLKVEAKIRYLHQASPAIISPLEENKLQIKFDSPQWAITPGQAVVFYDKDIVVGGGTIISTEDSMRKWSEKTK